MTVDRQTPSFVMFETFKDLGLRYKSLANVILTDKPVYENRSPRSRVEDKTWVSRYLVHAPIGSIPESFFADFALSSRKLASWLKAPEGAHQTNASLIHYFTEEASSRMKSSLDAYDLNGTIYLNVLRRISGMETTSEADLVDLLLLHFVCTGCTNDARRAADYVLEYAQKSFGVSFKTTLPTVVEVKDEARKNEVYLCLIRMRNNKLFGQPYYLNPGSEGTEIGTFSTAPYSINDVEETVSGRHLRIWRSEDGRWYAQGLNSKNGSILVSGADRSQTIIEAPRGEQPSGEAVPVEIQAGDELVLACDTSFMVMEGSMY